MQTVFIYDDLEANLKFFVLDGDYSHLHGVYLNAYIDPDNDQTDVDAERALHDELAEILFDAEGRYRQNMKTDFPYHLGRVYPEEFNVVAVGFIP